MYYSVKNKLYRRKYTGSFVNSYINGFSKNGKKVRASNIYFKVLRKIKQDKQIICPSRYVELGVDLGRPLLKIISKRVGGSFYNIPIFLSKGQGFSTGLRWLREGLLESKGGVNVNTVFKEVVLLHTNKGYVIRKRDLLHNLGTRHRGYIRFLKKK